MINIIICILCTSFLGLVFKYLKKLPLNLSHVVLVNYFICSILGIIIKKDELFHQESDNYFFSMILGLLFILGFNFFGRSIVQYGVGMATIVQKLSVIITIFFALYLGEKLQFIQSIGICLAFSAIYLLFFKNESKKFQLGSNAYILLASFGVSSLIEMCFLYHSKLQENSKIAMSLTCLIFIFAFTFGLISHFVQKERKSINRMEFIYGIILGIPNFFSILFLYKSLCSGINGSLFFPLLNISIILISGLIGFIYFKEKITNRQLIGYVIAVVAILFIGYH
ncbi:MAG: EamA family transporter [Saprospiraceae bacterium]